MDGITLHVLPGELLEQLVKAVTTGQGDWTEFKNWHRKKRAILRELGLDLNKPYLRPFNLPEKETVEEFAADLEKLYKKPLGLVVISHEIIALSRKRLGLKEAVRYLRELYGQKQWETLTVEFGYILAQLAHLSCPTWVTEKISLSFLWRMGWPLLKECSGSPGDILPMEPKPQATPVQSMYMSGIHLNPEQVSVVRRALIGEEKIALIQRAALKQVPVNEFEPGLKRIEEALAFAEQHGMGVLEACGLLD